MRKITVKHGVEQVKIVEIGIATSMEPVPQDSGSGKDAI